NRLYQNVAWPGGRKADPAGLGFRFEERAAIAGVADPSAGMGIAATDFNGDGRTDLFISNSRGQGHAVYTGQQPLASGSSLNDGRMDIAINTIGGKLELLRPTGATGHWLAVRLARFSPGAVVTAVLPDGRRLVREVQAGSSYLSSEDPRVHFGLGAATSVSQLVVRYPDARTESRNDVPADRIVFFPHQTRSTRRLSAESAPYLIDGCTRSDLHGKSVARVWDEAMLDAIRRDLPAPTPHARNL